MLWLVHMVHVWPEYVSSITSDDRRTDVDRPRVHKEDKDGRNACIFEYKQFDGMLDKCIYVSYPNESIEFNDNRAEDWWYGETGENNSFFEHKNDEMRLKSLRKKRVQKKRASQQSRFDDEPPTKRR
eukprot:902365_1